MTPVFVTGIGTNVGKTITSVIVANALGADYWKPVQAGYDEGTDSELVKALIHSHALVHDELYKFRLAASPHIAAREAGLRIDLDLISARFYELKSHNTTLVVEGAGGLLVPLNDDDTVIDLIKKLNAIVILVSRNYLGSINHSLLTAEVCRYNKLNVAGWIFNDEYLEYHDEISRWSGYPVIGKIPKLNEITRESLHQQSVLIKTALTPNA